MSISREEQFAALQEAQRILQLEKKWRRLVPDERKPDFKRAARVILQRALGHEAVGREPDLRIIVSCSGGLTGGMGGIPAGPP